MALATQCPHCHTTFRVAADQLKLRGGIVRCGACHEVFDGNAGLIAAEAAAAAEAQAAVAAVAQTPETPSAPAADLPEPARAPFDDIHDHPTAPPADAGDTPTTPDADSAEPPAAPAEPSASAAFDAQMAVIEAKEAEAESAAIAAGPVYKLDFDTTFDPFGILPKAALPEPPADLERDLDVDDAPTPASATAIAAADAADAPDAPDAGVAPFDDVEEISALPAPHDDIDLDANEGTDAAGSVPGGGDGHAAAPATASHLDQMPSNSMLLRAPSAPGHDSAPEPAPDTPASARAARLASARALARARAEPSSALVVIPKAPADPDEPEFVRRSRLADETGRTRRLLLAGAAVVLALLLLVQTTLTFHNQLAAHVPALKPALQGACGLLGCRVDLPAQIELLSIEPGELQKLGPTTFSLSTLLRNQGGVVQAWPHIELTLNDDAGKPVLRRVITPADYLPAASIPARGFPARAEQSVMLYFETSQLTADGYHLDIFYP
jgi:predicted Zn finger-like uncharacterized protein